MGTKRAFDEELNELIEHPRHHFGNKQASFAVNEHHLEPVQLVEIAGDGRRKYFRTCDDVESENVIATKEFETTAPLPLITGSSSDEHDSGRGTMFPADIFSDFFEYHFRKLHYDDVYSSLLDCSPRKAIPVGPDHQADVPEFDLEQAKNYSNSFNNGGIECFLGVGVIPMCYTNSDYFTENDNFYKASDTRMECKCLDGGSIRCVQQHVKEARLKLSKSCGHEKFVGLGMLEMGEEVACRWSKEEEIIFHEVVYLNPASHGRKFWKQLSVAFPSRTMKELVSYYFNVFILRRRAVQNQSNFLDIDSDDDEWRESYGGTFGDDDSSWEDGGDGEDDVDVVIGFEDDHCGSFEDQLLEPNSLNEANIKSPKPINRNKISSKGEPENGLLGSENGLPTA